MPSGFRVSADANQMLNTLVIGTRDIRPILEELERERQVLAMFDACYSGNTIRGLLQVGKPKYVRLDLEDLTDELQSGKHGTDTLTSLSYPYENTVYISAASSMELAYDINRELLRVRDTVDGLPHGALTDALLRGLNGPSDTNNDGEVTYYELYQYVRTRVSENFSQTPQILFPSANRGLLDQPLFRVKSIHTAATRKSGLLNVRLEQENPRLREKISEIHGIAIVNHHEDILINQTQGTYRLYLVNGAVLAELTDDSEVVERLKRQVLVQELIKMSFQGQNFNVFAVVTDQKAVIVEGEKIGFSIRTDMDSYLLLISIDPTGYLSVLYPAAPKEMAKLSRNHDLSLSDLGVVTGPDFGVEYIKAIAFKDKPAGFEKFMGREFSPVSEEFSALMEMLRNSQGRAAQMTLQVKTCAKGDVTTQ